MLRAIYAGSFDPPTGGHQWIIANAAALFDELIVAVAVNPDKQHTFAAGDRQAMLRAMVEGCSNVRVAAIGNEFLVHYAQREGAGHLVRGIRSESDYGYERTMCQVNADLDPSIRTVFLIPPRELEAISSSFVKGLLGLSGWRDVAAAAVPPDVMPYLKKHWLEVRWNRLVRYWKIPDGEPVFGRLEAAYAGRAYHNHDHLIDCFELLDQHRSEARNPLLVEFALWWHDAVDESTDPEAIDKSTTAARELFIQSPDQTPGLVCTLRDLIEATRHNRALDEADGDVKLLADIDLSILGQPPERYDAYRKAVRIEYDFVDEAVFARERAKILERFLQRPRIYLTEALHRRFEDGARANLKREIALLCTPLNTTRD